VHLPRHPLPRAVLPRTLPPPSSMLGAAETDAPTLPHHWFAAEMLGSQKVYPDRRAGMLRQPLAAVMAPEAAKDAETALELSRGKRREIQRRLRLAEYDPRGV